MIRVTSSAQEKWKLLKLASLSRSHSNGAAEDNWQPVIDEAVAAHKLKSIMVRFHRHVYPKRSVRGSLPPPEP